MATPASISGTEKRSQLARQRWLILRNALLSSARNEKETDATSNEASIHRFPGFQPHLLPRRPVQADADTPQRLNTGRHNEYEIVEYTLPSSNEQQESSTSEGNVLLRTREKRRSRGEQNGSKRKPLAEVLQDLTCHRRLGIDNTGSVCVWDSEAVLTHWLLSSSDAVLPVVPRRVVELGCGMAGLAGMSLHSKWSHVVQQVVLTDGHLEAVHNNQVCIQLTQQTNLQRKHNGNASIRCHQLLWTDDGDDNQTFWDESPFDLCLVSDCLHFTRFHSALLISLARLLTIGGVAILCQPKRHTSLQDFCRVLEAVNSIKGPLMNVTFLQPHQQVEQLHHQFLRSDKSYNANIHYPLLLQLQKVREVDLTQDIQRARDRMKQNDIERSMIKCQLSQPHESMQTSS